MSSHDEFPAIIAAMRPQAMRWPRPYYKRNTAGPDKLIGDWPVWLTDPPPSVMGRETAIPVTMLSRYHDQKFWSADFRRYGHQALKLSRHQWEGVPLRSDLEYKLIIRSDVVRAFGSKRAYRWMRLAYQTLVQARETALATYMMGLSRSVVESVMMRRRLHYEKKAWPRTDADLTRLRKEVTRLQDTATRRLNDYRALRTVLPFDMADIGRAFQTYMEQVRLLFAQCKKLDRVLGEEVQYLQYLVLGFLRQEEHVRAWLQNYMVVISKRINRVQLRCIYQYWLHGKPTSEHSSSSAINIMFLNPYFIYELAIGRDPEPD